MRKRDLERALAEHSMIKLWREGIEREPERGYVLALGSKLLLLHLLSPEVRFNGFSVLRLGDLSRLQFPYQGAAFVERVFELRGEEVSPKPGISLQTMGEALRSAGELFPLVTIHREAIDPEVCNIGRVLRVTRSTVHLHEINPGAEWDSEYTPYRIGAITRLDFGGGYEEALWLAAPAPPDGLSTGPLR